MDTRGKETKAIDEKFRLIAVCRLCKDVFRDPMVLPCLHTFCEQCLQQHFRQIALDSYQWRQLGVSCPICAPHSIVVRAIDLKTNAFIKWLISQARVLKPSFYCSGSTSSDSSPSKRRHEEEVYRHYRGFSAGLIQIYSKAGLGEKAWQGPECSRHPNSPVEYCLDCNATICYACFRTEHRSHKTESVAKATDKLREMIDTYWMAVNALEGLNLPDRGNISSTDVAFSGRPVTSHSPTSRERTLSRVQRSYVNDNSPVEGKTTPLNITFESARRELRNDLGEYKERFYQEVSGRLSYATIRFLSEKLVNLTNDWRILLERSRFSRHISVHHATPVPIMIRVENSTGASNRIGTTAESRNGSKSNRVGESTIVTDSNYRGRFKKIPEEDWMEIKRNIEKDRQKLVDTERKYMTEKTSLQQQLQQNELQAQRELSKLKGVNVLLNENNKGLIETNDLLYSTIDSLKQNKHSLLVEKQKLEETIASRDRRLYALKWEIRTLNELLASSNREVERLNKEIDKHMNTEITNINYPNVENFATSNQPEIAAKDFLLQHRIKDLEKEVSELRKELEFSRGALESAEHKELQTLAKRKQEAQAKVNIEAQYREMSFEVETLKHWIKSIDSLPRFDESFVNATVNELKRVVQEKYDNWAMEKQTLVEKIEKYREKQKFMELKQKETKYVTTSKADASTQCEKSLGEEETLGNTKAQIREMAYNLQKLLTWIETFDDPSTDSTLIDERQLFSNSTVQKIRHCLQIKFHERLHKESMLQKWNDDLQKMVNELGRKINEQAIQLKLQTEKLMSSHVPRERLENSEHAIGRTIEVTSGEPVVKHPQSVTEKNDFHIPERAQGMTSGEMASVTRQTSTFGSQRDSYTEPYAQTSRNYASPIKQELTGIRNFGNTCYFSSVIQPLRQTELLTKELLDTRYTEQKSTYTDSVPLTNACRKFFSVNDETTSSVPSLLESFFKVLPEFRGGGQHDSHDFLVKFLDVLRQEERSTWKSTTSQESRKKSLTTVDKIFGGHVITLYKCSACEHLLTVCEPFLDLSLPIAMPNFKKMSERSYTDQEFLLRGERVSDVHPESNQSEDSRREACNAVMTPLGTQAEEDKTISNEAIPLTGCLECFTQTSAIIDEYLCTNCTDINTVPLQLKSASRRTLIYDPPAVLVLHIKRFKYAHRGFEKCNSFVTYEELLDLGPYCSSQCLRVNPEERNVWYSLYGVVVHMRTLAAGHYIAYVKVRDEDAFTNQQFLQETFLDRDKVLNDDDVERIVDELRETKREKRVGRPEKVDGRWYRANDESVRLVDKQEALSQSAFLLFYERIPNNVQ